MVVEFRHIHPCASLALDEVFAMESVSFPFLSSLFVHVRRGEFLLATWNLIPEREVIYFN